MGSVMSETRDDRQSRVLYTDVEGELARIVEPGVQAVIWLPTEQPDWLGEVAAAVEEGQLDVPRTVLDDVTQEDVERWLATRLQNDALTPGTRQALVADVISLVRRMGALTGCDHFMVRVLTATPNRHCGYHVDTVMPGGAPWGLVRVYNGKGTSYIDSDAVSSMRDFYSYLGRRERLVRDALDQPDAAAALDAMDADLPFLTVASADATKIVPAGSVVAFRHLDIGRLWSDHAPSLAWIHCSPMAGTPRLVVNVTARGRSGRRLAPVAGVNVR